MLTLRHLVWPPSRTHCRWLPWVCAHPEQNMTALLWWSSQQSKHIHKIHISISINIGVHTFIFIFIFVEIRQQQSCKMRWLRQSVTSQGVMTRESCRLRLGERMSLWVRVVIQEKSVVSVFQGSLAFSSCQNCQYRNSRLQIRNILTNTNKTFCILWTGSRVHLSLYEGQSGSERKWTFQC